MEFERTSSCRKDIKSTWTDIEEEGPLKKGGYESFRDYWKPGFFKAGIKMSVVLISFM